MLVRFVNLEILNHIFRDLITIGVLVVVLSPFVIISLEPSGELSGIVIRCLDTRANIAVQLQAEIFFKDRL